MKLKWFIGLSFFLVILSPFYIEDNTGRSYLDLRDLRDPATVINGYQRLVTQMSSFIGKKDKEPSQLRRWTDERGIVNYSDSKIAPQNSEAIDLSEIKNTNFIAMEGHGSTAKAVLVYSILAVVVLLGLRYLWLAMKTAGKAAYYSASSRPDPASYTGIEYKPGANTSHTVLGVAENASAEEIKKAYRQKMSQFHPDKVANMSEHVREKASKQAQLINAAYKELS